MPTRMHAWVRSVFPRVLARAGAYLYSLLIVLVASSALYLAVTLSGIQTFAEIRPTLQSALAPIAVYFGTNPPPVVIGSSVRGIGTVVALDALDIHSPVSARIRSVPVTVGQTIAAGDVVAVLDDTAAARAVRDAELEERNARLELERARLLTTLPDTSNSRENQIREAATVLASVFTNMPWVVSESDSILYDTTLDAERANINFLADKASAYPETATYQEAAASSFRTASEKYRTTRLMYQAWTPGEAGLIALLRDTEAMLQSVVRSLVAAQSFFTFVKEHYASPPIPPMVFELEKGIAERATTASDNLASVSYILGELSSEPVTTEPNTVDIRDAELRLEAAIHAREDRVAELQNYSVRSPIAGEVAELIKKTAVVEGEILARVASPQSVVRISLSEADVARIRSGMDVRLIFPGIDGLNLVGRVVLIDREATVSNNTVTFYVYVSLPEGEHRPRPGMSVEADIAL